MDEPPEWFTDQENRKAGLTGEPVPEDAAPESPSDAPSDKSDDADADKPTNKRVRRVTTEESK